MSTKDNTNLCESGIVALCFNKDRTQAAFSPNNHLVYVFSTTAGGDANNSTTWRHLHTLDQHEQAVMGISWHPETNRILTVAQDRTAYVWESAPQTAQSTTIPTSVHASSAKETWVPQMVVLDAAVKRGLLCCAWAPHGKKLYVGSAACNVAVGTFSDENSWWYCKVSACHSSSVTTLSPHPTDNTLIATGSTDGTLSLLSTLIKSVDGKDTGAAKFGTKNSDITLPGTPWVHCVTWAPSGNTFAACTHDSRVYVMSSASGSLYTDYSIVYSVSLRLLPMKSLCFIGEGAIIAAGYDFHPILIEQKGEAWVYTGKWTNDKGSKGTGGTVSQAALARQQFQNESRTGQKTAVQLVSTKHKNVVTNVISLTSVYASKDKADGSKPVVVTTSMDGTVEFWTMGEMQAA